MLNIYAVRCNILKDIAQIDNTIQKLQAQKREKAETLEFLNNKIKEGIK